ncbi:hypothetical protein [Mesorhizobium sp. M1027]|uniref:hypothetical protein n=1 Tax=Mesorhizobium sp. M1027 TaxID=2957050 RepID=UPI00333A0785
MSLITIAGLDRLSHGATAALPLHRPTSAAACGTDALLAIWELLAHAGAADPRFLPRLEEVAARGMAEFSRGGLGSNLLASLERDLIGFVYGSVAESRLVRRSIFPPYRTPERLVVAVVLPLLRDLIPLTMPAPSLATFWTMYVTSGSPARSTRAGSVTTPPSHSGSTTALAAVVFSAATGGRFSMTPTNPMVARTGRPSTA